MKIKDLIIYAFSLALLYGVYIGLSVAVTLTYVVILIAAAVYLLCLWGIDSLGKEDILEARSKITPITPIKTVLTMGSSGLFAYVYYITNNHNLLFTYILLVGVMWTFIYKLFTTDGEE